MLEYNILTTPSAVRMMLITHFTSLLGLIWILDTAMFFPSGDHEVPYMKGISWNVVSNRPPLASALAIRTSIV